jgi:hypothetical protein
LKKELFERDFLGSMVREREREREREGERERERDDVGIAAAR